MGNAFAKDAAPYIRLYAVLHTIKVSVITIGINPYLYIKGETLQYQNYTDTSFVYIIKYYLVKIYKR